MGIHAAKSIAREIERRRILKGVVVKQLLPALELSSPSGWTKRTHTEAPDWVPFRTDEIAAIIPVLSMEGDVAWPYLDEEDLRLLRGALQKGAPMPVAAEQPAAAYALPEGLVGREKGRKPAPRRRPNDS